MRKAQSKGMSEGRGFGRSLEYLETRGSRRAKPGSHSKSRKFGERLEEQVEGSEMFEEGPEGSVVFDGPRETWLDNIYIAFFFFCSSLMPPCADLQLQLVAHSPRMRVQQCHCWSRTGFLFFVCTMAKNQTPPQPDGGNTASKPHTRHLASFFDL